MSTREKLILAGLYLAKFDQQGLERLGFGTFREAFNVISLSLQAKPASLKNYRDEFDPLFPNRRRGWHKRAFREYCKKVYDEFGQLNLEEFTALIKTVISHLQDIEAVEEMVESMAGLETTFAKRLLTGQAAVRYFESTFGSLNQFEHYSFTNTTRLGCGFDYKLDRESHPFLAVEVKGMNSAIGQIQMTDKEFRTASVMAERYYLFVVRNFAEEPFHSIYRNPFECGLKHSRQETRTIQVTWSVDIGK